MSIVQWLSPAVDELILFFINPFVSSVTQLMSKFASGRFCVVTDIHIPNTLSPAGVIAISVQWFRYELSVCCCKLRLFETSHRAIGFRVYYCWVIASLLAGVSAENKDRLTCHYKLCFFFLWPKCQLAQHVTIGDMLSYRFWWCNFYIFSCRFHIIIW